MLILGLSFGLAVGAAPPDPAVAAEACDPSRHETPLRSEQGSAGIMVNIAEAPDSIRAMAKSLLDDAEHAARRAGTTPPAVVFRVTPSAYLPLHQQQALCTRLATDTSLRPLKYPERRFTDVEDFDAWLMDFSQGRGADGKLLYTQCGGNCDPSFTFVIAHGETAMQVTTEVYCGYARDRRVNLYTMSTTLRAPCAAVVVDRQMSDADLGPHQTPRALRE